RNRSSSLLSGCQSAGQLIGVAVRYSAAATADGPQFGCSWRMSAATPAACGEAIEVPLSSAHVAPWSTTVTPGELPVSPSSCWKITEFGGTAASTASWTVPDALK